MIILHFDLQPQFIYMNYSIYTSHQSSKYFSNKFYGVGKWFQVVGKISTNLILHIHLITRLDYFYFLRFPILLKKWGNIEIYTLLISRGAILNIKFMTSFAESNLSSCADFITLIAGHRLKKSTRK